MATSSITDNICIKDKQTAENFVRAVEKSKKKNQWLSVADLIEILQAMPQDAKVVVNNDDTWVNGDYIATRDSVEFYEKENIAVIGTNHNTQWEYKNE